MMQALRRLLKEIPTLLLAFAMAVAVWISAVTADDPTEKRLFPRSIALEVVGQDPGLIQVADIPEQVSLTLSAPRSVWEQMTNDRNSVRAIVDLSGLGAGEYVQQVQIQITQRPVQINLYSPRTVNIHLEPLVTRAMPVRLVRRGDPAVGYQLETPSLSEETISVSGPESVAEQVTEVRALLDVAQASTSINRQVMLAALDENENLVEGVTLSPDRITINQPVTQRGGYRNVAVRVVYTGQIASGYRLTNITPSPLAVTVFAADPRLVDDLPGFVETGPIDLTGAKDDFDMQVGLNLPDGISVVGEQQVVVQVGVAAIEGSLTLSEKQVELRNQTPGLSATISPETVDVIISGPLPVLDSLVLDDVVVYIDLTGVTEGTYQLVPKVEMNVSDLRVESILPSSIEVVVSRSGTTPTPRK